MPLIAKLGENPAALSAISGLMGAMNAPKAEPKQESADTAALLSALLGQKQTDSGRKGCPGMFGTDEDMKNRIALLYAVKPFLGEERRGRLDTVIRLMKLAELGKLSSLLGQ